MLNQTPPKLLTITLFILWIFFVLATFFAVQKPFAAANALAMLNVLLDLLAAGWLVLVGLGLGSWLLNRVLPTGLSLLERLVFGTGLGLGALGLLAFGLGLLGLFHPAVAYGITVTLSVVVALQLRKLFQQVRRWQPANRPNRLTILYLSAIGVLALPLALLPPTDWDGLFYHLTGPKLYLQAGGIIGGVDIPHFSFPFLMEMFFAWVMLLRGDVSARLLHAVFGLLLVGLVYLMTRRFLSRKAAWPAVIVLASMPMLGTLAAWAYNDLALAFYQLAAIYAVGNWLYPGGTWLVNGNWRLEIGDSKIQNGRWLILSGLFTGLAMGLKYTAFVTPLVVVGLIFWRGYQAAGEQGSRGAREQGSEETRRISHSSLITHHSSVVTQHALRTMFYSLALFAITALLIASPWYLKNWTFTGNPVYPFLFDLFGGRFWDEFRANWYASAGTGIGWRPSTLLALPWLLTLGVRDANFWDGRTGPLLLLFLPAVLFFGIDTLLFGNRKSKIQNPKSYNLLLIYALIHFLFWTLGVIWSRSLWQSRLLLPGLVGLAPLAGWVWTQLPNFDLPQFSLSRFANIAIGLALTLTVIDVGLLTLKIDPLPYLVGLESRDEYLTRRLGAHYAAMQQINTELPAEAKIVFLWEPRSYYCRRDCRPDSILDEFPHLVYQHGSAQAIAQRWHAQGVSHVLLHRSGLEFMLNESPQKIDRAVLAELERTYWRKVFDVAGAYQLYALKGVP